MSRLSCPLYLTLALLCVTAHAQTSPQTTAQPDLQPGARTDSQTSAPTDRAAAQVTGNYPAIEVLDTTTDVLGAPLQYPDCPASVHAVVITLAPGQIGQRHQHLTPLFAYILSGELKVDYDPDITRTYRAGDALMEAMHVMHHGYNPTNEPVRLLAVYMNCAPERD